MKRIIIYAMLLATIIPIATTAQFSTDRHVEYMTFTRYPGENIKGIVTHSDIDVVFVKGDQTKVYFEIEGDDNYVPVTTIDDNGIVLIGKETPGHEQGKLKKAGTFDESVTMASARPSEKNNKKNNVRVTVTLPEINHINGGGNSTFTSTDTFSTGNTTIKLSGNADIKRLKLNAGLLTVACEGYSSASITGEAQTVNCDLGENAQADINLKAGMMALNTSGESKATLKGKSTELLASAKDTSSINDSKHSSGKKTTK